jgi:hypothetical protein
MITTTVLLSKPLYLNVLRLRQFLGKRIHKVFGFILTKRLRTFVRVGDVVLYENDLPDTYKE